MNKAKKRWTRYQVDGPKTAVKSIDQLTEAEAKDELCDAMDLIEKMLDAADFISHHARKARYLS